MKKLLFAMTAVSALAAAAPAGAQYTTTYQGNGYYQNGQQYQNGSYQNQNGQYGNGYYTNGYGTSGYSSQSNMDARLARLDARIQTGIDNGTIDQREAWTLRRQLSDISRLDQRYSRDGYTAAERSDMQRRLRSLRDQLASADGGPRGWGNGYGSNNGYYGQGGPYEQVTCAPTSRSGLGGLIDSIFGRDDDSDCTTSGYGLTVGSRVSGNLGAVPYAYRNQYRDGYGYYYRSDGQAIYQIDSRTNTVLRVYPMNR